MKYEDFVKGISARAADLFQVEIHWDQANSFVDIAPQSLSCKHGLILKRKIDGTISKNCKTILITSIKNAAEVSLALTWTSLAKEEITDPESSDLYLFIHFQEDVALDICLRIESTEQFCRKYVLRTDESIDDFLSRTFLNRIKEPSSEAFGSDPLNNVFAKVATDNASFTKEEQDRWKDILLSGSNGIELISELFDGTEENEPK